MANRVGRPSKFDTLDLAQVQKLATLGFTNVQMADFFGVEISTFEKWAQRYEEFFRALKIWKAEADQKVERSLYERAMGYSHPEDKIFVHEGKPIVVPTTKHYAPDTTACIFWLKNRRKDLWRDKQEVEVKSKNVNFDASADNAEEAAKNYAVLMKSIEKQ